MKFNSQKSIIITKCVNGVYVCPSFTANGEALQLTKVYKMLGASVPFRVGDVSFASDFSFSGGGGGGNGDKCETCGEPATNSVRPTSTHTTPRNK